MQTCFSKRTKKQKQIIKILKKQGRQTFLDFIVTYLWVWLYAYPIMELFPLHKFSNVITHQLYHA